MRGASPSEQDVGSDRNGGPGLPRGVDAEARARRALLDVDQLQVQPPAAGWNEAPRYLIPTRSARASAVARRLVPVPIFKKRGPPGPSAPSHSCLRGTE